MAGDRHLRRRDSVSRLLPPGLHLYDALQIGDYFDTDTAEISAAMIKAFAALTGDRFDIHLSDSGAQAHGFPSQVAHGLLVLSVIEGLKSTAPVQLNSFASLGWTWHFTLPVLSGDTVECRITLLNKRRAGPKSGLLTLQATARNQHGRTVQHGETRLMVHGAVAGALMPATVFKV